MPLPDSFGAVARQVNNWGRWGADDQLGTLNLVTDEVVLAATGCVRSGRRFPLAMDLSANGPQAGLIPGRDNPVLEMIGVNESLVDDGDRFASSDDRLHVALQSATHWDALAHVTYAGRTYNDHGEVVTDDGASALAIANVRSLVTRAVLLDIPRARGVDWLVEGEHLITPEDLDAAEAAAGVQVRAGDVVLLRTGQVRHFHAGDRIAYAYPSPGPTMACAIWFHRRDVAAVATDTITFDAYPGEDDDLFLPLHLLHLVEMGMLQGQNWDLEALAADCAEDGQHDMLLTATPEPVVAAVGAPVAPVAIK